MSTMQTVTEAAEVAAQLYLSDIFIEYKVVPGPDLDEHLPACTIEVNVQGLPFLIEIPLVWDAESEDTRIEFGETDLRFMDGEGFYLWMFWAIEHKCLDLVKRLDTINRLAQEALS